MISVVSHSEDVLPSIHADKYYPCELVGTWNTWYGEQDQAGRTLQISTKSSLLIWAPFYSSWSFNMCTAIK